MGVGGSDAGAYMERGSRVKRICAGAPGSTRSGPLVALPRLRPSSVAVAITSLRDRASSKLTLSSRATPLSAVTASSPKTPPPLSGPREYGPAASSPSAAPPSAAPPSATPPSTTPLSLSMRRSSEAASSGGGRYSLTVALAISCVTLLPPASSICSA
eukprot:scaffold101009_cov63-Phaeocystis_antarctica.AAC.11